MLLPFRSPDYSLKFQKLTTLNGVFTITPFSMKSPGLIILFCAGLTLGWVFKGIFTPEPERVERSQEKSAGSNRVDPALEAGLADEKIEFAGLDEADMARQEISLFDDYGEGLIEVPGIENMSEAELREMISTGYPRKGILRAVMYQLFAQGIDVGFRFIEETASPELRNRLVEEGILAAASIDPDGAFTWVKENTQGRTFDLAVALVVRKMALNDPMAALAIVESLPYGRAHDGAMSRLARQWGKDDPVAALKWLDGQPASTERLRAINDVYDVMAHADLDNALAYAMKMQPGNDRDQLMRNIASVKANNDPREALAWVASLGGGKNDDYLYYRVMNSWIKHEPADAAEYYLNNELQGPRYLGMQLAESLARRDPGFAADWAMNLPDEKTRESAVMSVVDEWLQHDPNAASKWISKLESGATKDSAIVRLVNNIRSDDSESAFEWASTISDSKRRTITVRKAYQRWSRADPDAASKAIESGDFTDQELVYIQGGPKSAFKGGGKGKGKNK